MAMLGGKIAHGTDAGAYGVFHGQAALDEYKLLKGCLGERTDEILKQGETEIQKKF